MPSPRLREQQRREQSVPPDEAMAAQEQLHDKLLPVVVGLYRSNKLSGEAAQ